MGAGRRKMLEDDHRRLVGRALALARTAKGKRPTDWVRQYPLWLTHSSKLLNWEAGLNYPPPLFLLELCKDYGFTMDWFYRQQKAGVSAESAADLRRVEVGTAEGPAAGGR